jgi:putative transcription factor
MCDMCGTESRLFKTSIEGSKMNVCKACSKFGRAISQAKPKPKFKSNKNEQFRKKVVPQKEMVQVLKKDFSKRIREAREKLGFKQIELAKKLAERESLVQKIESNQFTPSIRLARKLENHLRIKIIEQHEEKHDKSFKTSKRSLTIGDMLGLKS